MTAAATLKLQKVKPGYSQSVGDRWPCCLPCVLGAHDKCVKPCNCAHTTNG